MGQIQSLEEFLNLISRRRWLIGVVAGLGILLSVIVAKARPDSWEAAAVIQVQFATVSGQEPASPGQSGSAQLLQAIEQRLTTRENLLAMVERHGLFADAPALSDDQKVALLRRSITFQSVASAANQGFGAPSQVSALIVFARMPDPEQAARVANDFAQGFLDQGTAGQMDRANETWTFFQAEEQRLFDQMSGLETQIAAYKNANAAAMPAVTEARREELVSIDARLRDLDQSMLELQGALAALGNRDTLRATQQREYDEAAARLAVADAQRTALLARRAEAEAAIAATPEVERVLAGYNRQLEQLQGQYDVVTRRLAEAETARRLAESQQSERFALLERAVAPEQSLGSGGRKLAMAGALVSVVAGLVLAFLLDLMHPVVRTSAQMERQIGLRPVVAIPDLNGRSVNRNAGRTALLAGPRRLLAGIPRYAMIAGGASALMVLAAAVIA